MKHINEHTLELYVLNAAEVRPQVEEIELHLKECQGCRSLMMEMAEFHGQLRKELQEFESHDLVRTDDSLVHLTRSPADYAPSRRPVPMGRVQAFIRRHPLVVTGGSLGFAMILGVLATIIFTRPNSGSSITDTVPAGHAFNIESNTLEILNSEEQILWDAKVDDAHEELSVERGKGVSRVLIGSTSSNGKERIFTTLPLVRYPDHDGRHLRIFDEHKTLLDDIHLTAIVAYRGRENTYSPYFNLDWILLCKIPGQSEEDIVVTGNNVGRSPSIIFRLNADGGVIGKYYHFGNIGAMYGKDLYGDGREELIAIGTNDVEDSSHEEFPVIAVLDPGKITGEAKASACGRFLLPTSAAELYYIRLPLSDIDSASYHRPAVAYMEEKDAETLQFASEGLYGDGREFIFHYQFDHEMRPLRVLSNNAVDALHKMLVDDGTLRGTIDRAYLERLKNGIRYWNGREWVAGVTKVRPG
ncbi:MAG TPA: hypothetical protein VLY03_11530 [Bacteroidota bacterium]|nr:hypothetical protein [Bacteroidota bacterium]